MSDERTLQAPVALAALETGGAEAERLVSLLYEDLRARAKGYLRGERAGHSLQPTALVHEAYLRLAGQAGGAWQGKSHFFAAASIAMRRVLLDYARGHTRSKRGGGAIRLELDEEIVGTDEPDLDVLALNQALERLTALNERHARIVELRFFCGLTTPEIAEVLGLSTATVEIGWRFSRTWLRRELSRVASESGDEKGSGDDA